MALVLKAKFYYFSLPIPFTLSKWVLAQRLKARSHSGNEEFLPRPPAEKIWTRCLLPGDPAGELPASILEWETLHNFISVTDRFWARIHIQAMYRMGPAGYLVGAATGFSLSPARNLKSWSFIDLIVNLLASQSTGESDQVASVQLVPRSILLQDAVIKLASVLCSLNSILSNSTVFPLPLSLLIRHLGIHTSFGCRTQACSQQDQWKFCC